MQQSDPPGPAGGTTLRSSRELADAGLMSDAAAMAMAPVEARFAVAVPSHLRKLLRPGEAADPIARQVLPDLAELVEAPEELADPIGDEVHSPVPGIVHRYPDRVLLKPLHACPLYCRFCFRRESVGPGAAALDEASLGRALDYIRSTPAIWEVILSGGDPLLLSPRRLRDIALALEGTEHVAVLRLHSRVPVAAPERITERLAEALRLERLAVYLVVHCNHAREITPEMRSACRRLAAAGIGLLAQSVLLKGVNDDAGAMEALLRGLVAARIKPYYLHHADLARGTGHFRTTIAEGQALVAALRGRLSGLCQPTYVLDIPGGHGKIPIGPSWAEPAAGGRWRLRDPAGGTHIYPPAPLRD